MFLEALRPHISAPVHTEYPVVRTINKKTEGGADPS